MATRSLKTAGRVAFAAVVSLLLLAAAPGAASVLLSPAYESAATRFVLRVPVVYFHHIECPPPDAVYPSMYECPEQFEAQMAYLRDNGWEAITADELADLLAERRCPEPKRFVISFDDGYTDAYTNAAPIMEGLGMRGTFFVNPGLTDETGRLSFDQMRDLVARGHAIGNHSLTHQNLRVVSQQVLYQEVEGAQELLATELGYRPRTFAYPYGRYNDTVIAQVASSGLELAFTVHRGAREASDAPLESKRIRVAPLDTGPDVLAKLDPYTDGCPPPTADLLVALASDGPFKGDNIYSPTPLRSQSVRRTGVEQGVTYRYWVRLENDGQFPDTFAITATTEGTAGMDVRYRVAGVDVTSQVVAGGFATPLEPWSGMTLVVRVTPLRAGAEAEATKVILQAVPSTQPTRIDVARVVAAY